MVLAGIILLVYFLFSDGEFSLVFTLSGTVQTFGFALVVLKIRKSRSVGGLSRETFICYTLIFAIRAVLFMFYKVCFLMKKGIFTVWLKWWFHIQISINFGNCTRWVHSLLHRWAIQDKLQPWLGRHKIMVLDNRGSGIRSVVPFEPQPICMGRFRLGVFSIPINNRNSEPIHPI